MNNYDAFTKLLTEDDAIRERHRKSQRALVWKGRVTAALAVLIVGGLGAAVIAAWYYAAWLLVTFALTGLSVHISLPFWPFAAALLALNLLVIGPLARKFGNRERDDD